MNSLWDLSFRCLCCSFLCEVSFAELKGDVQKGISNLRSSLSSCLPAVSTNMVACTPRFPAPSPSATLIWVFFPAVALSKTPPGFSRSGQIVPPHSPVNTSWLFWGSLLWSIRHALAFLCWSVDGSSKASLVGGAPQGIHNMQVPPHSFWCGHCYVA